MRYYNDLSPEEKDRAAMLSAFMQQLAAPGKTISLATGATIARTSESNHRAKP